MDRDLCIVVDDIRAKLWRCKNYHELESTEAQSKIKCISAKLDRERTRLTEDIEKFVMTMAPSTVVLQDRFEPIISRLGYLKETPESHEYHKTEYRCLLLSRERAERYK